MDHPYKALPASAFWRRAVAGVPSADLDPVIAAPFTIQVSDRVATAGSCFAQHIARHLQANGFTYLVSEPSHPILSPEDAERYNYGVFTARYGNIYTTRQLLQLAKRAYGKFTPVDDIWTRPDGRIVDPFRPQINPDGFTTPEEYFADRRFHFKCVREAFETLDYFVFTLGLTETWASREDGAVYPVCPGVAGGTFDPTQHEFKNLGVSEVTDDLREFLGILRGVNRNAKVILTVSPVPLVATASDQHVLVATTYSKSVLRVACAEVCRQSSGVTYFPSYEIITGSYNRGSYFAEDLRSVTESGISHVMGIFLKHFGNRLETGETSPQLSQPHEKVDDTTELEKIVRVLCDEEMLDQNIRPKLPAKMSIVSHNDLISRKFRFGRTDGTYYGELSRNCSPLIFGVWRWACAWSVDRRVWS